MIQKKNSAKQCVAITRDFNKRQWFSSLRRFKKKKKETFKSPLKLCGYTDSESINRSNIKIQADTPVPEQHPLCGGIRPRILRGYMNFVR